MADDMGVPLAEFAKGRRQPDVAQLIGVTQSAISQMLSSTRDIRVRPKNGGGFEAVEIRLVGSKRSAA